jgi:3-hydroxyisobutyrate dehydrogenase-like beta-hydroxyacid dehydrogenase
LQVGFIGLGAMGALIVPRLMAAGHSVTGWNRRHGLGRYAACGRGDV